MRCKDLLPRLPRQRVFVYCLFDSGKAIFRVGGFLFDIREPAVYRAHVLVDLLEGNAHVFIHRIESLIDRFEAFIKRDDECIEAPFKRSKRILFHGVQHRYILIPPA